MSQSRRGLIFWLCLSAAVLASRLCHIHILWADEDYHLAGAIQVLAGKFPYRDFWYDKPPLNLLYYLTFGARTGVPLRIADAAFVVLCCVLAYRLASTLWSNREGYFAAAALAFFSIFYLESAVLPEEPDTLMLLPHLAAVYLALRRRPLWAGIAAGVAFQLNVKGALVLLSAALFAGPSALPMLVLGFLIPNAIALGWIAAAGAFPAYLDDVWKWGFRYAGSPPPGVGVSRLFNWLGFHAALVIGATCYWMRSRGLELLKSLAWCAISLAGASVGFRFAPHYLVQLLPALVIPASRGFSRAPRVLWLLIAGALLVPAIRFGHHYVELGSEDLRHVPHSWRDVAMDSESRAAANIVLGMAKPGDTIFIWGYRPGVIAYSRLPVAGRLWDSQLLTGVPADRHLYLSQPVDPELARRNRRELLSTHPTFLVDGLSEYNSKLDIHLYPELAPWLAGYCPAGDAGLTRIYHACKPF